MKRGQYAAIFCSHQREEAARTANPGQTTLFFGVREGFFGYVFDEADPNGVYCPFCVGCGSIVKYPYLESDASHPMTALGMFDVSARPFVPGSTL